MSFKNSKERVNCVNRSIYSSFFWEVERTIIENPWELKGECTVLNSIFSYVPETDLLIYDYPLTVWFEETVNLFKQVKKTLEKSIGLSFNPNHLIEIEIINLSAFFETGKYISKSPYRGMMSDDVHQYYERLLWGEDVWIGCSGIVLKDRLVKLEQYIGEGKKKKIEILSEIMQEDLEEDWMSSSKLQVLLWLKGYLEALKPTDIKKFCLRHKKKLPFQIDLKKGGFQVVNPDKTIPALYEGLVKNNLIAEIKYVDFENAFLRGQGSIQWLLTTSNKKKSLDAKSLIYLINRMVYQELIKDLGSYILITSEIFIDKNRKPFIHGTLNDAVNGSPINSKLLKEIVDKLKPNIAID